MSENPNQPATEPTQNQPAQSPAPQSAPEKKNDGETLRKLNSPLFIWPAAITLAILLYLGLALLANTLTHESTDDAFIAGHIVSIAPRIDGQVSAVHVLDNQIVRSNDLLIEIDPSDYSITVAQKQAAATSQAANFRTVVAAYELMQAKVTTANASALKAKADANSAESTAKKAQADFERAQDLLKQNTISRQEFDSELAANTKAQADLQSARENVDEEISKVDEAGKQLAAVVAEKDMAFSQFNEAQTNVASAELNLSYTKIFAPGDGRVTRKQVEVGDYLQTGQQIMWLVPVEVWVVANFKESQLRKMKPGQNALVEIDALGGRKFRAHVDSVQAGSGAAFSLLPPENATGNFVKVIQRVPVKIIFDEPLPADHTIGPGLSVTPSVQTSSFDFPDWAIALIAIVLAVASAFGFQKFLNRKTEA
ncbi:MAG TPA: HlyD family secretion protein [Dongiaceae bacterium]|jgi:membrane fusion protein (multidrug efflux system)|nr:HlyD family secretion protein [Dongiaceae bacterium]